MSKRHGDICRIRLLVVDDDHDVNSTLCTMLTKNYPTQCILSAHDAESALQAVSEYEPDIIIVDVMMSKCDAIGLTPLLMHGREDRIIIHMSAKTDYELINECYEAGSRYFIRKPIEFERLFYKLDSLIVDLFYQRFNKGKKKCMMI